MQIPPFVQREIDQCSLIVRQYFALIQAENERLAGENAELRVRLNQNCTNSSQPPSSSPFLKPKSLRLKTGRKPGGQVGHQGSNLRMTPIPDEVIEHKVEICSYCGCDLSRETANISQPRQVVDVKIIRVVTQHTVQSKTCPVCGKQTTADFPRGVDHYLQYGNTYNSLMVYLNKGNYIPYSRLAQISKEVLGIPVSQGTLVNIVHKCGWSLKPYLANIKDQLKHSSVVHFDETGTRVKGKNQWLHSTGNEQFTYLETHPNRGSAATRAIGILPAFTGTAVHDFWKPYYNYSGCKHAICNAHILRELNGIVENYHQTWAVQMKDLLLEIKQNIEDNLGIVTMDEFENFENRYDAILRLGEKENPLNHDKSVARKILTLSHKRGRRAHSKPRNLLDRMRLYKQDILRFMEDTEVPFDNNLAERDIRMSKVQQKVSGCFRSDQGNIAFNRIRSYIATARKQGISVLEAIQLAFTGKPLFTAENH
jgi:transposase